MNIHSLLKVLKEKKKRSLFEDGFFAFVMWKECGGGERKQGEYILLFISIICLLDLHMS